MTVLIQEESLSRGPAVKWQDEDQELFDLDLQVKKGEVYLDPEFILKTRVFCSVPICTYWC